MKITHARRFGAALIAPALAVGMIVAAPSAQANTETQRTTAWLADQVGNDSAEPDLFVSHYDGGEFTDYGLNLDLYTALRANQSGEADRVYDAVIADADAYTDPPDFETGDPTPSSGAIGKLATATQLHGDSAAALVTRLEGFTENENTGGFRGFISADPTDYTNTITQSLGLRALSNAGSAEAGHAAAFLLKQQCPDGSFRQDLSPSTCRTAAGSVDSTSFAIQALKVAAAKGVANLQDDIADAASHLSVRQAPNGSYVETSGANSNSTGLAAVALLQTCHPGDANLAAQWVMGLQVEDGSEKGAIALNQTAFDNADDPIAEVDRDQFVRASVQAVLGLDALDTDKSVTVTRTAQFVSAGLPTTVTATGLVAGDPFAAAIPGGFASSGTADGAGKANVTVTTPTTSGTRPVTVCGAQPGRWGSVNVTVLAARTFKPKLKFTAVKRGKSQRVTVAGLAAGEPVKVYFSGKLIKTAVATDGTYTTAFAVGYRGGKKTVKVIGAFSNRTGSATFTVG